MYSNFRTSECNLQLKLIVFVDVFWLQLATIPKQLTPDPSTFVLGAEVYQTGGHEVPKI